MREIFNLPTKEVAKALLGKYLVHRTKEGTITGKIVETEAYLQNDLASHSFNGKTKRNEMMFGPAGRAYIYFTYGMHHCFNVVTNKEGVGEAVLIRALEPLKGIEIMKRRRKMKDIKQVCNGPAKLVQALGIKNFNGADLIKGKLKIIDGENIPKDKIIATKRIGISKGASLPLRFYIRDSDFVSQK